MYMSQDWLMRQIQILVAAIAKLLFNKDSIEYEIEDEDHLSQTDLLYKRLMDLVAQGKLCRAEDLLFERLDPNDLTCLALAMDFYQVLNRLTDEELEAGNFSRGEIDSGIHDVLRLFGICLPGF